MAGLAVGGGERGFGGRRALDSDLNMVPMIDLLMVLIAFLLVTAVWSSMARMEGRADVPGQETGPTPVAHERSLHVDMRPLDHYVLAWRDGNVVTTTRDVPRDATSLARAVAQEWRTNGTHLAPADPGRDRAVLHVSNETPFSEMVATMDAVESAKRAVPHGQTPAFALTLATQ
jgi:biopolymer transport protein ExbD